MLIPQVKAKKKKITLWNNRKQIQISFNTRTHTHTYSWRAWITFTIQKRKCKLLRELQMLGELKTCAMRMKSEKKGWLEEHFKITCTRRGCWREGGHRVECRVLGVRCQRQVAQGDGHSRKSVLLEKCPKNLVLLTFPNRILECCYVFFIWKFFFFFF